MTCTLLGWYNAGRAGEDGPSAHHDALEHAAYQAGTWDRAETIPPPARGQEEGRDTEPDGLRGFSDAMGG